MSDTRVEPHTLCCCGHSKAHHRNVLQPSGTTIQVCFKAGCHCANFHAFNIQHHSYGDKP